MYVCMYVHVVINKGCWLVARNLSSHSRTNQSTHPAHPQLAHIIIQPYARFDPAKVRRRAEEEVFVRVDARSDIYRPAII